ncbi:MAG: type II secretion system protein [Syntrophobacteraceae bacterium]
MKKCLKRTVACLPDLKNHSGFTLIELVLATVISTLVIGIISVSLSFALRAWESTQNRRPDQSAAVVDLIKRQLSQFDPTPIKFSDGERPLFTGTSNSIAFATSHSVRAISQGATVVVRYSYDPKTKALYYSELPFDPYHPKTIADFTRAKLTGEKFRFYRIDMANFSLAYGQKDKDQLLENWKMEGGGREPFPRSVLLGWTATDGEKFSQLLLINSPFEIRTDPPSATAAPLRRRSR